MAHTPGAVHWAMRMPLLLITALTFLPGCVVWDIRDEMRRTNAQVGAVQESLAATNQRLDGVDTRLTGTNERLQGTNTSLTTVEEQLLLLREINSSMGKLDVHLASLRKTIGAINNMMPFLDLGDAPAEEAVAAEPGAEAAQAAAPAEGTAQPAQPTESAPAPKREVLLGLWVSAYPDSSRALIIMPDGKYLHSKPDSKGKSTQTERGTWKKGEKSLTLQPDLIKIMAPPMQLMNATTRSFAVQDGEQVWVYTRP